MNTGSMIVISKTRLKQINGGVDPNANHPQGMPNQTSPVALHGTITPNGVYDVGVSVMLTPNLGINTSITSTENVSAGGCSIVYRW